LRDRSGLWCCDTTSVQGQHQVRGSEQTYSTVPSHKMPNRKQLLDLDGTDRGLRSRHQHLMGVIILSLMVGSAMLAVVSLCRLTNVTNKALAWCSIARDNVDVMRMERRAWKRSWSSRRIRGRSDEG
jgi:hypothetical protein